MIFFGEDDAEIRICPTVGGFDHEMHYLCLIFSKAKWWLI
jgi:hypothetical protein